MKLELILSVLSIIALSECKREPKFSPYIDVTRAAEFKLVQYKQSLGVKSFSLAFALGGTAGCSPMWAAQIPIESPAIINEIKAFRAAGGDVIVSTGGALGPYLETSCGSPAALLGAYKKVLAVTGSTHLDIDIESSINIDAMNQALASLQKENPAITVSFTLMIQGDDYGLTDALGVGVLQSAAKHGVNVDIVNPMTMDFGSGKDWGDAIISAAEATHKQMKKVWPQKSDQELYSMLGVTPMLGVNDNQKLFSLAHAQKVVSWAKSKAIGHLGFWSMGRDKGCPGHRVDPGCSSIAQGDYAFTKIFMQFDDGHVGPFPTDNPHPTKNPHPTQKPDPTPRPGPTTRRHTEPIDCSIADKKYPHESDCTKYYWCFNGVAHIQQCNTGTIWDTTRQVCNYPKDANRPECL